MNSQKITLVMLAVLIAVIIFVGLNRPKTDVMNEPIGSRQERTQHKKSYIYNGRAIDSSGQHIWGDPNAGKKISNVQTLIH